VQGYSEVGVDFSLVSVRCPGLLLSLAGSNDDDIYLPRAVQNIQETAAKSTSKVV
jgi:hypothetical protein